MHLKNGQITFVDANEQEMWEKFLKRDLSPTMDAEFLRDVGENRVEETQRPKLPYVGSFGSHNGSRYT